MSTCENCEKNEAVVFCPHCNEKQCQSCLDSIHIGKRASHLTSTEKIVKTVQCENCSERPALYFCPECNEKQCGTCMDSIHVGKRKSHLDKLQSVNAIKKPVDSKSSEIERLKAEKLKLEKENEAKRQELESLAAQKKSQLISEKARTMEKNDTNDKKRFEEDTREKERAIREQQEKHRNAQLAKDRQLEKFLQDEKEEQRQKDLAKKQPSQNISSDSGNVKKIFGHRENATSTVMLKRNFAFSDVSLDAEYLIVSSSQPNTPTQIFDLKNKDLAVQSFSCEQNDKFISASRVLKQSEIVTLGYSNGRVDCFQWGAKCPNKRKVGQLNEHRGVEIGIMELGCDTKNSYLFTVGKGKSTIIQADPEKAKKSFEYTQNAPITHLRYCIAYIFDTDIPVLLSSSEDGMLYLYNCLNGKCLKSVQAHQKSVDALHYDQIGEDILDVCFTGSSDGIIIVWDLMLKQLGTLKGHTQGITCLASDGERDLLFSGSNDATVRVWSLKKYECLYILGPHTFSVSGLVVKNHLVYSSGSAGEVGVFDLSKEECMDMILVHNNPLHYLFAYGGRVITASTHDQTLRINGIGNLRLRDD